MRETNNLELKILDVVVEQEETREVITEYSNNFEKIDNLYKQGNALSSLNAGQVYPVGEKLWNSAPEINKPVGWVNTRQGTYANARRQNQSYQVGDLISSDNSNYYFECVSEGKTPNRPTVFLGAGVEFFDVKNVNTWRPNTNYVLDEVVIATNGSEIFYYIVEVSGASSLSEPNWSSIGAGTTLVDGSVTWRKEKNPKWIRRGFSANFRPFGLIS